MKEVAMDEERRKFEIAEATFFALPEAQIKALDGIKELMESHRNLLDLNENLRNELSKIKENFKKQNSWKVKWKEWLIAFVLGILASLVAAFIWMKFNG